MSTSPPISRFHLTELQHQKPGNPRSTVKGFPDSQRGFMILPLNHDRNKNGCPKKRKWFACYIFNLTIWSLLVNLVIIFLCSVILHFVYGCLLLCGFQVKSARNFYIRPTWMSGNAHFEANCEIGEIKQRTFIILHITLRIMGSQNWRFLKNIRTLQKKKNRVNPLL